MLTIANCGHEQSSASSSGGGEINTVGAGTAASAPSVGEGGDRPAAGGANGVSSAGDNSVESGGTGGVDTSLPEFCNEVSDCDDDDACTLDSCEAVAGCVHVNPNLDCRGWSGSKCAASAIQARGSGDQTTCVPPITFELGASICADQVCRGAPGCELTYTVEGGSVSSTAQGYDFEGRVVALAGTVKGMYGALECIFEVGLSAPEPFVVHYGLSRPDCSQVVRVAASAQATWSGVAIQASPPECAVASTLVRSVLTTSQLNDYLQEPLETLTCAACAENCPGEIACR